MPASGSTVHWNGSSLLPIPTWKAASLGMVAVNPRSMPRSVMSPKPSGMVGQGESLLHAQLLAGEAHVELGVAAEVLGQFAQSGEDVLDR